MAIAKLKKFKSPGSNKIQVRSLLSTNPLILFAINKNGQISGWNLLLYQFTKMMIKLAVIITMGYRCYQFHTKFYRTFFANGGKMNAYILVARKPEGKRPLGKRRHRWVNNIKADLLEIEWDVVHWFGLPQYREI
jgi:hypothetical protein